MEHSCIDELESACMIAREAPVFTQADYEAVLDLLETAHKRLRSVFVGGQHPGVPSEWRIDGLLYRACDIEATKAKDKLLQKYRASKFFSGQRRKDQADKAVKANQGEWRDLDGVREITAKDSAGNVHVWKENMGESQASNLKRQGFDVRQAGSKFQFATRKES